MNQELRINNLHVQVEQKEILRGIELSIVSGDLHVVMGPNGSGKSTLASTLMGNPTYEVTEGHVLIGSTNILELKPNERANKGVMLAFQNPLTIPGVTLSSFLRTAYNELHGPKSLTASQIYALMLEKAKLLSLDQAFLRRSINDGFSGGEKKKAEMLQLLVLQPKFAIFDEIDTGLDVDALKSVSGAIQLLKEAGTGILLITHYQRILNHVVCDHVHVMKQGQIVKSGGRELVKYIEEKGYADI